MQENFICHMVQFNLIHPIDSLETKLFLQDGLHILSAIPVVQNFKILRQISLKNNFSYGFSMQFANQSDYDAYNLHPSHIKFVEERWKTEVNQFLEMDFTPYSQN